MKFKTIIGRVDLTSGGKRHLIERHPIMEDYLDQLKQVLETPDEIRLSNRSNDVLLFYRYFDKIEGGKYVAVVVNKTERVVLTTYLTHRIKSGSEYEKTK